MRVEGSAPTWSAKIAHCLAALALAAAIGGPVGAASASERTLLVEAIKLINQADAAAGATQAEALISARERLKRIANEYPDSATAKQILGDGVPVLGGAPISLAAMDDRIRQFCLAHPTQVCLFEVALEAAKAAGNDVFSLNVVAVRQSEAGLFDDARSTFAIGRERALVKLEQGDDYALGTIARGQAEAWMFEDAIETAALLGDADTRMFASGDITEKLGEAGRFDDAERFVASLPEKIRLHSARKLASQLARSGRLPEALAIARTRPTSNARSSFVAAVGAAMHSLGLPVNDLVTEVRSEALAGDKPVLALTSAARTFRLEKADEVAKSLIVEATARATSDKSIDERYLADLGGEQAWLGLDSEAWRTYAGITDANIAARLLRNIAASLASRGAIDEVISVCTSIGSRVPTSGLARDEIGHQVAGCLSSDTVTQLLMRNEPEKAKKSLDKISRDYINYLWFGYFDLVKFYAKAGDFEMALAHVPASENLASAGFREITIEQASAGLVDAALESAQTLSSPQDVALAYAAIAAALPR